MSLINMKRLRLVAILPIDGSRQSSLDFYWQ